MTRFHFHSHYPNDQFDTFFLGLSQTRPAVIFQSMRWFCFVCCTSTRVDCKLQEAKFLFIKSPLNLFDTVQIINISSSAKFLYLRPQRYMKCLMADYWYYSFCRLIVNGGQSYHKISIQYTLKKLFEFVRSQHAMQQ